MKRLIPLAALLVCAAAAKEIPPYHEELSEFSRPGFALKLPKGFKDAAEWDSHLVDNRTNANWMWGTVQWQAGQFSQEQFEQFSAGQNCPANQGQKVFGVKVVKTKNLMGVRLSCGDPDGKPFGDNPGVSGWTEIRGNSKRFDRRYVIHLDYWGDPRDKKIQAFIDTIVLSFKERGSQGLTARKKAR